MLHASRKKKARSPMSLRKSHSPSPSTRSAGSGRSTPSMNGYAGSLEDRSASPQKLSPSNTPVDRRSVASIASSSSNGGITPSSTMECITVPSLPKVVTTKKCHLRKRPDGSEVSGWGFMLRGTTSEFKTGTRVYMCHVEVVKENGAAMNAGIRDGDQIVAVDGVLVRDLDHSQVVKMFQTKDKVELILLPIKFKGSSSVRITEFNQTSLSYLWSITTHIQSLEIVNVQLPVDNHSPDTTLACFTYIPGLRHLSITHCGLESLQSLKGLQNLRKLESLSLSHNFLSVKSLEKDSPLSHLTSLKKLDLSNNLLTSVPPVVFTLQNLETLVLIDNNIQELNPSLSKLVRLTTLCVDGNLLTEVDTALELLPHLKMVTLAHNQIETEPYCVKHQAYVIASIEGNPYTMRNGHHRLERTMSVKLRPAGGVIKSQERTGIKRISSSLIESPFSTEQVIAEGLPLST